MRYDHKTDGLYVIKSEVAYTPVVDHTDPTGIDYIWCNADGPNVDPRHIKGIVSIDCYIDESSGFVSVSNVLYNNEHFEITDMHGNEMRTYTIPVSALIPLKTENILSKRINAIKNFLLSQGTGKSYEDGYKALNTPKRDDLWKLLQKYDPDLFRCGKDDFFKEVSKKNVIKFTRGRPK